MPVTSEQFRADLIQGREDAWAAHNRTGDRWMLSLAIGNGGAFLALGARVLDKASEAGTALAMPSLWLFAVGLVLAGINPFIEAQRTLLHARAWERAVEVFDEDRDEQEDPGIQKLDDRIYAFQMGLELTSGLAFVGGLFYPLVVLSHRYLTSGHGFF